MSPYAACKRNDKYCTIYRDYIPLAAYAPSEEIKEALLDEFRALYRIIGLMRGAIDGTSDDLDQAEWDFEDLRDLHKSQGIDILRLRADYEVAALAEAQRITSERAPKPSSRLRMPSLPQLPFITRKLGQNRHIRVHVNRDVEPVSALAKLRDLNDAGAWLNPYRTAARFAAVYGDEFHTTVFRAIYPQSSS
ncbi:hypothetical protein PUNSTDRAFT_141304 [Punctularia strigosozonata HHB-11173 SS5]|uniref:uncharacterized protein n=1 Tax=Punctularia strigosozonata (strain HHB-11173) TaxID=741275 RepID=UPI0004416B48|nr:uncharacterized protein PUNSTDRAFT_141304 [Punctularia strigosozonata HHB-11173 SS5]EIN12659.1 hypothetical protein PUNSTDRAFT_141304 [Punctularia strigosozonata HHB-11173 SS5]